MQESDKLLKDETVQLILVYCLATSNFMNGKDNFAIKLDHLDKFWETKSNDGKQTLFMYIID